MKRKTILALGLVAATAIGGAIAIPAVASGWNGANCGHGPAAMQQHGPAAMQQGNFPGMMMQRMQSHFGGHGFVRAAGPMNSPIYQSFDADKDGTVSADELKTGIAELHAKYDADGNGSLSASEFGALHAEATRGFADRPFKMLDADGNGEISAEEMNFPAQMMARFAPWMQGNQPAAPQDGN